MDVKHCHLKEEQNKKKDEKEEMGENEKQRDLKKKAVDKFIQINLTRRQKRGCLSIGMKGSGW